METFLTSIGLWLPFAVMIGVLLLLIVLLLTGARTTCCKPGRDWVERPPIDFQALRGERPDDFEA